MARLIDADELMWHKSSLVEPRDKTVSMGKPISDDEVYAYRLGWNDAIDAIMDCAPTADAVEVVRCNDCRFFKGDGLECHWGMFAYEDDYCSNGERREDADKGHEG